MPSFCKSICFVAYVNHHQCEWIYRQVFYLQASHVPYHLTVKLMPTNVHRSHEISWKSAQCWLLRVTSQVSTGYLVTSQPPPLQGSVTYPHHPTLGHLKGRPAWRNAGMEEDAVTGRPGPWPPFASLEFASLWTLPVYHLQHQLGSSIASKTNESATC